MKLFIFTSLFLFSFFPGFRSKAQSFPGEKGIGFIEIGSAYDLKCKIKIVNDSCKKVNHINIYTYYELCHEQVSVFDSLVKRLIIVVDSVESVNGIFVLFERKNFKEVSARFETMLGDSYTAVINPETMEASVLSWLNKNEKVSVVLSNSFSTNYAAIIYRQAFVEDRPYINGNSFEFCR